MNVTERFEELKKHYDSLEKKTDHLLTIVKHTRITSVLVLLVAISIFVFGVWVG